MAEYRTQVYVCTNAEQAEDKRHCGDKAGVAVWKAFREARKKYNAVDQVLVTKSGCTGRHKDCGIQDGVVVIYGAGAASQGVWYRMTETDVDEVFREHVMNGRPVERLLDREISVKWSDRP